MFLAVSRQLGLLAFVFLFLAGCATTVVSPVNLTTIRPDVLMNSSLVVSEKIIKLPAQIDGKSYQLEAKLFVPQDGRSVHPLLIMTHGRSGPTPSVDKNQVNGHSIFNRTLARQGYTVLLLVRRGYGNSDGPDSEYLSSPEASGLAGAKDLKSAVEYMRTQTYIDPDKIAIVGQSQGGWMALAASSQDMPGVLGTVNISGATNFGAAYGRLTGQGVEGPLKQSASIFGGMNKRPVLWLYASNDNHSISSVTDWFNAYAAAGGKGKLLFTPNYGTRGHSVVNAPTYYLTELLDYFNEIGFK